MGVIGGDILVGGKARDDSFQVRCSLALRFSAVPTADATPHPSKRSARPVTFSNRIFISRRQPFERLSRSRPSSGSPPPSLARRSWPTLRRSSSSSGWTRTPMPLSVSPARASTSRSVSVSPSRSRWSQSRSFFFSWTSLPGLVSASHP
jgi:hypothetical protein